MSKRDATRRSVRCLFLIRRYIIFFLLMAFVITCCMILFLNMMTRTTGLELTQEHIEQAAKEMCIRDRSFAKRGWRIRGT